MILEGHVASLGCEVNLNWSKSMREINSLSLVFIDFNATALTLHLNCNKTALQLSENTIFLVIRGISASVIGKVGQIWGESFMYIMYRTEVPGI
jgi:hypothetical protein